MGAGQGGTYAFMPLSPGISRMNWPISIVSSCRGAFDLCDQWWEEELLDTQIIWWSKEIAVFCKRGNQRFFWLARFFRDSILTQLLCDPSKAFHLLLSWIALHQDAAGNFPHCCCQASRPWKAMCGHVLKNCCDGCDFFQVARRSASGLQVLLMAWRCRALPLVASEKGLPCHLVLWGDLLYCDSSKKEGALPEGCLETRRGLWWPFGMRPWGIIFFPGKRRNVPWEKNRLEHVFPIERLSLFRGHVSFQRCTLYITSMYMLGSPKPYPRMTYEPFVLKYLDGFPSIAWLPGAPRVVLYKH